MISGLAKIHVVFQALVALHTPDIPLVADEMIDCDTIRSSESMCLACNIYHEARSESFEGRVAVANVTRNRKESILYPDTYCDVVWQRSQFSWTNDGKSDKVHEQQAWIEARVLAYMVTNGKHMGIQVPDITKRALWYHTLSTSPYWAHRDDEYIKIDNHKFYTQIANKQSPNDLLN